MNVCWRDKSDNETGFRVDRSTGGDGNWTTAGVAKANAGFLQDTGLTPGATYTYRVVAQKGSTPAASATATVTMPASGVTQYGYNAARSPWSSGVVIQAEDFDAGGDGVADYDTTTGNAGGYYRASGTDVGFNIPNDRYFVGWTKVGDWTDYTVDVPAGTYQLQASVASQGQGGTFAISAGKTTPPDGTNQSIVIPDTGSFTTYQTVNSGTFTLAGGVNVIRVTAASDGSSVYYLGDMDWLQLNYVAPPPPTGSISGTVFNDANNNGSRDTGESGLSGWQVFADTNGNGIFDPGEPTTTSAADGTYTLGSLAAGTYSILETPQSGYTKTEPGGAGAYGVTLTSGQAVSGKDFGNYQSTGGGGNTGSISGTVYNDANDNGIFDTGESGLGGWQVYIDKDNSGTLTMGDVTTTSNADGTYTFNGLAAGTYTIRETVLQGYAETAPTSNSNVVTLANSQDIAGKDFGDNSLSSSTNLVMAINSPVPSADSSPIVISEDTPVTIKSYYPDGTAAPWALWMEPVDDTGKGLGGEPILLASGTSAGNSSASYAAANIGPNLQSNGNYKLALTTSASDPDNAVDSRYIQITGSNVNAVVHSTDWATISWSPDSQATTYVIYRSETADYSPDYTTFAKETTSTSFDDASLQPGHTYYYRVYTISTTSTLIGSTVLKTPDEIDDGSSDGEFHPFVGGQGSPSIPKPAAIAGVNALGVNDLEIFVTWQASSTQCLSGYQIQISSDGTTWYDAGRASAIAKSFIIRQCGAAGANAFLQPNVTYQIRVGAYIGGRTIVGGGHTGNWSENVSASTRTPNVNVAEGSDVVLIIGGNRYDTTDLLNDITIQGGQLVGATNANSVGLIWEHAVNSGYNAFITADPADGGAPTGYGGMPQNYSNISDNDRYIDVLNNDGSGLLYNELLEENRRGMINVGLIGYSHGGGMVTNISDKYRNDPNRGMFCTIIFSGTIDAVKYGTGADELVGTDDGYYARTPDTDYVGAAWPDVDSINYYETNGWSPGFNFYTGYVPIVNARIHGIAWGNATNIDLSSYDDHSLIANDLQALNGVENRMRTTIGSAHY